MRSKLFIISFSLLFLYLGRGMASGMIITADTTSDDCRYGALSWQIGSIDSRFDVDESTLKNIMQEVADEWSKALGRPLIAYSDSGDISLNLIYSEAQKYTDDEQALSRRMNGMKMQHYSMQVDFKVLNYEYHALEKRYNETLTMYEKKLADFNYARSRWNRDGAVTSWENDRIKNKKEEIIKLKAKLDRQRNKLENKSRKLDSLVKSLNSYADEVNEVVYQYRNRFGENSTFHQGFYINNGAVKKINIYQFDDLSKLRLVLMHEVGHALGLKHRNDRKAIMYYKMDNRGTGNIELTDADIEAVKKRCGPN